MEEQQGMETVVLAGEAAGQRTVAVRTIERWIKGGGLKARQASQEQLGWLVGQGRLRGIPPHGQVWLIQQGDLDGYQPRRVGRRRRGDGGGQ